MITCTRTFTRPTTSVLWHNDPGSPVPVVDFKDHLNVNYRATGKLIDDQFEESTDGLSKTYTAIWASLEDYNEYDTDPVFVGFWEARDIYNESVGITATPVEISELG